MFELKELNLTAQESTNQKTATNGLADDTPMLKDNIVISNYLCSSHKRMFDLVFSLLSLPLLLPLTGLSALFVLLTMGMPVMFKQKRVGKNGKVFLIYKLRTLKRKSTSYDGLFHSNGDITPLGKLLRIFRFDEFPQLINIFKGEMSWVGPRPEVPYYVEKYSKLNEKFSERHQALPGITGLAQVENPNATPHENLDKLVYDLEYIEKASLGMDLKIVFNTFFLLWK